jgi:hypothetical protein
MVRAQLLDTRCLYDLAALADMEMGESERADPAATEVGANRASASLATTMEKQKSAASGGPIRICDPIGAAVTFRADAFR